MVEKKEERKHLQTHHTHTRMVRMQNGANNSVESYTRIVNLITFCMGRIKSFI